MKKAHIITVSLLALTISSGFIISKKLKSTRMEKIVEDNEQIINTGFFYIKKGKEKEFEKLRSRGNVLLEKYGAKIERVIKPKMLAAGELELPDEIHFAVYPNKEAKEAFDQDPEFIKLKQDYIATSVDKMFGFTTKKDPNFKFYREIGDATKTYGVALIYYKEGEKYQEQFAEYHNAACEIIPEFGTHFERFLIPFASANNLQEQPDEIHRFYFDSQEGMQSMVQDPRMKALFPKRDASLKNLVFLIGEAIQ
ncbi:hypothetical protein DKG77_06485 [Flagellimonas aquimarina]|uniref:DUF1330 domain-containing protein n=1 Tax=Flagellimonas aquimarina TaxID=2201895 RepID=A0A316L819_9FLAO|nr:hypothetical protein [Allomuricauda koreensis]PWL40453.1 hypothetical protein DKG77_06485 [Allomuricauda koreensis]